MITVTVRLTTADGLPDVGSVLVQPVASAAALTPDPWLVTQTTVRAQADSDGRVSCDVLASDDPAWQVDGVMPYRVTYRLSSGRMWWAEYVFLTESGPVIDLARLTPLTDGVDVVPVPVPGPQGEQGEQGERGETGAAIGDLVTAAGDLVTAVADGDGVAPAVLPVGAGGDVLTPVGGIPEWVPPWWVPLTGGTVTGPVTVEGLTVIGSETPDASTTGGRSPAALVVAGGMEFRRIGTNVGIGDGAQRALTTGSNNAGVGYSAQSRLTTGRDNVGVGYLAQQQLTTGYENTALGYQAQSKQTTGRDNVAVGAFAQQNAVCNGNVAVGHSAQMSVTGSSNTAVGGSAQKALTTGIENTAVGVVAQTALTTGKENVAIGVSAQRALTTGRNNVAVGHSAQYSMTTQYENTAIGFEAQYSGTGYGNTAVGHFAQRQLTTGRYNLHLGCRVGTATAQGVAVWGTVAIGTDSTGVGAYTDRNNTIVLGTEQHTVVLRGPGKGIEMRSPDGTRYLVTVADGGTLQVVAA